MMTRSLLHLTLVVVLAALFPLVTSYGGATQSSTERQSNGESLYPPLSYDGRFVAFYSAATNLVPDDTNDYGDIFIHDQQTKKTSRVSVSSKGTEGDRESTWPSLSGNARFVAFTSSATNLVDGDTNDLPDVFVHDRETSTTSRISVSTSGEQSNGISYNYFPAISEDGSRVVFASTATNLAEGDTNGTWDVFVHDRNTGTTTIVSRSSANSQGDAPSLHAVISGNGKYVAFNSFASNLIPRDTNGVSDIFLHDLEKRTTEAISVDGSGAVGNQDSDRATISFDGSCVGFSSFASNLAPEDSDSEEDVFIYERVTAERTTARTVEASKTVKVTAKAAAADEVPWCCYFNPFCCTVIVITDRKSVIAADGNSIAYRSDSPDLVEDDTNYRQDIFLYDAKTGKIERVSVSSEGEEANGDSVHHGVSANGRYVAFSSTASNLVPNDTNGVSDIFVRDRQTGVTTRVSVPSGS